MKPPHTLRAPQDPSLVPFEVLETKKYEPLAEEWPTFSLDAHSRYSGFVTTSEGVFFFSFDPWLQSLENEFQNTSNTGSAFRINILKNGPGTLREQIVDFEPEDQLDQFDYATACVVLQDSDIGYFLLTSVRGQPQAVTLDKPGAPLSEIFEVHDDYQHDSDETALAVGPARSQYQPPASLWAQSSMPKFIDRQQQRRNKKPWKDEIRLSAASLDTMTEAHLILSQETHNIGVAAADLFRRCERLQIELRDQIKRANDVAYRTEGVLGKNADDYKVKGENEEAGKEKGNVVLQKRLEDAKERQETLMERLQELRAKVAKARGSVLSEKEESWIEEVHKISDSVVEPTTEEHDNNDQHSTPWQRYKLVCKQTLSLRCLANDPRKKAKQLVQELVSHTKEVSEENPSNYESGNNNNNSTKYYDRKFNIPSDIRQAKVTQVMDMLSRESVPSLPAFPHPVPPHPDLSLSFNFY